MPRKHDRWGGVIIENCPGINTLENPAQERLLAESAYQDSGLVFVNKLDV